ncbi:MAG: PKD domain-containing protein, partial [Verrucomicrobiota bacterium]
MGAYEFHGDFVPGALKVEILMAHTNVFVDHSLSISAEVEGDVLGYTWSFGDVVVATNRISPVVTFPNAGTYDVILSASNDLSTVAATVTVHVVKGFTNFVSLSGGHISPFTNWVSAATNIQAAIDAHIIPGGVVMVSNVVYASGGRTAGGQLTNRIVLTNRVRVSSVNGPEVTFIKGAGPSGSSAVRCAYVGNYSRLVGFTLTEGHTVSTSAADENDYGGGGVYCERLGEVEACVIVSNNAGFGGGCYGGNIYDCEIRKNKAVSGGGSYSSIVKSSRLMLNGSEYGGGGARGEFENCLVARNTTTGGGGGLWSALGRNCTIVGNHTDGEGGGVLDGDYRNSVIYYNTALSYANFPSDPAPFPADLKYCCTMPLAEGVGNFVQEPGLIGFTNPHLLLNSVCVDRGKNAFSTTDLDIDREPRIVGEKIDIGCDEVNAASATNAFDVRIGLSFTNIAQGFPLDVFSDIEGQVLGFRWHLSGA